MNLLGKVTLALINYFSIIVFVEARELFNEVLTLEEFAIRGTPFLARPGVMNVVIVGMLIALFFWIFEKRYSNVMDSLENKVKEFLKKKRGKDFKPFTSSRKI